jgi:sec-independent protein translocase protein TatB
MFGIGMPEMLLILAIALIVIGPKKLPDLAKSLGRALGEFKRATSDLKETLEIDADLSDVKKAFDDMNQDVRDTVAEGVKEAEEDSPTPSGEENPTPDQPLQEQETADLFSPDTPAEAPVAEENPSDPPDDPAAKAATPEEDREPVPDERKTPAPPEDPNVEQEESTRHG